jgi:hypothetical protein
MRTTLVLALTAAVALLAGCASWHEHFHGAERISFNQLTPAAQATVRQEIGNQPIINITREYTYGDPSYRVEVERKGVNPTLWVASDGSIIKESRRLIGSNVQLNEAAGAQRPASQSKPTQQTQQSSRSNY